jgi:hypothetical protein
MAHRIGVIAWGALDSGLSFTMDEKMKITTIANAKKLTHFAKSMASAIDDFRSTALKNDRYNLSTLENCGNYIFAPRSKCGGAQKSQEEVMILGYIILNLFILNPKKYKHFMSQQDWILTCCRGFADGGLPPFLAEKFKILLDDIDIKQLDVEFAEQVRDLCKELFVCMYNYRYVGKRGVEEINYESIETDLYWYFDVTEVCV